MKRYNVIKSFRLDDFTYERLLENMKKDGDVSESEYIRKLILNDSAEKIKFNKNDFFNVKRILAGCGNNLNQIAHRLNMDMAFTEYDNAELKKCEMEIKEMRKRLDELAKELVNARR
jgi:predicted DNA-binding protein